MVWIIAAPCPAQEVGGLWLSTSRSDDGMAVWLEFGSNQRLRSTLGTTTATRWRLVGRDNDRYRVDLSLPYLQTPQGSIELRLTGQSKKLIQTEIETGSKTKLHFVARGRQGAGPEFLGRWVSESADTRTTYDFNDDGWLWIRTAKRSFSGQYRIDGDRLIPIWDAMGPEFRYLERRGSALVRRNAVGLGRGVHAGKGGS